MPRVYCVAYGCLSSAVGKPGLSFFKLPSNTERRSQWLRLICREDLMSRQPQNYVVCEEHFLAKDILKGLRRKVLKSNSLPCLNLPDRDALDEQKNEAPMLVDSCTQTEENVTLFVNDSRLSDPRSVQKNEVPILVEACTQTEENVTHLVSAIAQNSRSLPLEIQWKRKLKSEPSNILNNEVTSESIKTESDDEEMEHQDDWTVSQDQIAITDGCEEVYSDQSTEAILPVEQHLLEAHQASQPQGIEIEVERKNDYFDNFGKYIVSMLRSLPAHAALTLQPKIVNLIVQEIEKQNFQDNDS